MNKKLAFDNRLCYERSLARQQAIHHQKLQSVVPTALSPSKVYLDSNAPARQPHVDANPKRRQQDRERQMDIAAQNHRLASKMDHIMHRQENILLAAASTYGVAGKSSRTPAQPHTHASEYSQQDPTDETHHSKAPRTPVSPAKTVYGPARVHMPGIRLDATQTPLVDCYLSPEVAIGRGAACLKHTLINRGVQKRQQERIAEENRRLKQRVQSLKPFYNSKQWDSDWQKTTQKFGHIHQNGTVGYLLPPPKTAVAKAAKYSVSPRALKAHRNVKTSHDDKSDDGSQVVELAPCLLLEATTRKGVQIRVEELQVELVASNLDSATNGSADGDRGLVIRGLWGDDVRGEHLVNQDALERIAQEIDDIEIMIKLETVRRIPQVGNFPRLSELLTEAELETLLVRLVQWLHVEIIGDQRVLAISTRNQRIVRGAAPPLSPLPRNAERGEESEIEANGWQHRRRPRTCPSVVSRSHDHSSDYASTLNEERPAAMHCMAANTKKQARLKSWLSNTKERIGIRHHGTFFLASISYSAHSAALVVSTVNLATCVCATTQEQYSVEKLAQQLESREFTCEDFVRQELLRRLP